MIAVALAASAVGKTGNGGRLCDPATGVLRVSFLEREAEIRREAGKK